MEDIRDFPKLVYWDGETLRYLDNPDYKAKQPKIKKRDYSCAFCGQKESFIFNPRTEGYVVPNNWWGVLVEKEVVLAHRGCIGRKS